MKQFTFPSVQAVNSAGTSTLSAICAAVIGLTAFAQTEAVGQAALNTGDIVYVDSGDAITGGLVIKVDPATGEQSVISAGGLLSLPFDVAVGANGQIVVSDSGRLISIDAATGAQTLVADNSQGTLGSPYGIAFYGDDIVAANLQSLIAVDPATAQVQTVSTGGNFQYPMGVTVGGNGDMYVINMASVPQIVRVNPQNGGQKVISKGGYLKGPQSITMAGDNLYVTDTTDGSFGTGRVIQINARTGKQRVVSEGGNLVGPVGISVDAAGQLVVGDAYTVNPQSPDIASGGFDGAIIRINPATGAQTIMARGQGSAVNPRGLAIVGE
jgi:sugar lactone lactonase YvrE